MAEDTGTPVLKTSSSQSILNTIKSMLGISITDVAFDSQIISFINGVISILYQEGVAGLSQETENFEIVDSTATWSDYLGDTYKDIKMIQTYIYLKVRLLFDPPSNSAVLNSIDNQIKEYEYRIFAQKGGY